MGSVMTPAFPASPSYALSAQGSERAPLGAWHRLLGDLRGGRGSAALGLTPCPKMCALTSSMLSDHWIFVCVGLPVSCSLPVFAAFLSGPLPPLLESLGVQPRPVIPCRMGLELTAPTSASLPVFSPTGSFYLLCLRPLTLPRAQSQVSVPPTSPGPCSSPAAALLRSLSLFSVSLPSAPRPLSAWGHC